MADLDGGRFNSVQAPGGQCVPSWVWLLWAEEERGREGLEPGRSDAEDGTFEKAEVEVGGGGSSAKWVALCSLPSRP
jgi:hypothetical protein